MAAAPTKYAVTITLSGQQGDVMRMHRQLPPALLERFRLLFQEVDACNTVHAMTHAKRTRADIAKATGRSIKWVAARQNEMKLLQADHRGRKKLTADTRMRLFYYPYAVILESCQELNKESGTMSQVIQVQVRSVYGAIKIYPANEAAELIAKIAGTKTISSAQLAYAKQLGFQVEQVEAYQLAGAL